MGTKMAVAFANIPCPTIEREIQRKTELQKTAGVGKMY